MRSAGRVNAQADPEMARTPGDLPDELATQRAPRDLVLEVDDEARLFCLNPADHLDAACFCEKESAAAVDGDLDGPPKRRPFDEGKERRPLMAKDFLHVRKAHAGEVNFG